jgi:hypothetical protein
MTAHDWIYSITIRKTKHAQQRPPDPTVLAWDSEQISLAELTPFPFPYSAY